MTLGIIIGFEYNRGKLATFPGTIVDIHHAYDFCTSSGMKTVIISDIEQKKLPKDIMIPMVDGFINPSIMSFVEEIEEQVLLVNSAKDLISTLITVVEANNKERSIFFYYSGHGDFSSMGIATPDNGRVKYMQFRDILTQYSHAECQIIIVLDCCHPTNLGLAYTLADPGQKVDNLPVIGAKPERKTTRSGRFVDPNSLLAHPRNPKIENERFRLNATFRPCEKKILLITSAAKEEKSAASRHDSFFSRYFFMYLMLLLKEKPPSRNLNVIREAIKEQLQEKRLNQNMAVHSSYNMIPLLWCWIGSMKHDIIIDYGSKSVYMKPLSN